MKSEVKAKQTIAEDGGLPPVELILREDGTLEIHSACEWGRASFVLSAKQTERVCFFLQATEKRAKEEWELQWELLGGSTLASHSINSKHMATNQKNSKGSGLSWMNETLGCGSTLPANPPEVEAVVKDESSTINWGPSPLAQDIAEYSKYQSVREAIARAYGGHCGHFTVGPDKITTDTPPPNQIGTIVKNANALNGGGTLIGPPDEGELVKLLKDKEREIKATMRKIPLPPKRRVSSVSRMYWIAENDPLPEVKESERTINAGNPFDKDWSK